VAARQSVLKVSNPAFSPKRKDQKPCGAVLTPLPVLERFDCPFIRRVSASIFLYTTLIRQAQTEDIECFLHVLKIFVPTVEEYCVTIIGFIK
jgi:hypothetical protein